MYVLGDRIGEWEIHIFEYEIEFCDCFFYLEQAHRPTNVFFSMI